VPGLAWGSTLAAALRSAALAVGAGITAALAASALLTLDASPTSRPGATVVATVRFVVP
jgi:hypothetical protein